MPLSNAEQYLLELINRTRMDPVAEAARYGIDLNNSLTAGQITATAKQVLAPNEALNASAESHSVWMIATDTFSHTGVNGSRPWDRAIANGYGSGFIGENIAFSGTTGASFDLATMVQSQHGNLFLSAGHRVNMLGESYREAGIGQVNGAFTYAGTTYNASLVTEVFGLNGNKVYVTGVAYNDTDSDAFYSIGEGRGGVVFSAGGTSDTTASSGGYAVAVNQSNAVLVTGTTRSGLDFSVTVDMTAGNVKLDLVNDSVLHSSASLTLGTGIRVATLLGSTSLILTGNVDNNVLVGNRANNTIHGLDGNDILRTGIGNDRLFGDAGRDSLFGGRGTDRLWGGVGNDRLSGDTGNDILSGDGGADSFIFHKGTGVDTISDFDLAEGDRLVLNDTLWNGQVLTAQQVVNQFSELNAGDVCFDFGAGGFIRLDGVGSTAGLASAIDFI